MHPCPGFCPLQFLHRPQYPLPHRKPAQVALIEHDIRLHGGMDRRVVAVVLHDEVGGAVDVEVGDHRQNLEPGYLVRPSTEFTPAELDCLRLAIVGTGVNVLSHLNAMPLVPN